MGVPLVVNISLGTNGGAHDGSSGVSRWLDAYLAAPGRAICIAAGNAGQEKAQTEGDLGWIMGRIHSQGRVPARGLEVELEWTVVGDGIEDRSENELEVWYGSQDRFAVAVKPPGDAGWIAVNPREFVENYRLPSGTTLSIYNELYHPTNGANYIAVYLSPNLDPGAFRGIDAGVWKVRLVGEEVRDGRFNAWIERDDPAELEPAGGRRLYRFPSFFTEATHTDSHSISSLACGHRIIAVSNLDDARQRINATSSQGPTRDGRYKPEIAAPGTDVVAANGFAHPDQPWISMSGTSMASPYVAGVVGLMLAANPGLSAAQCAGILLRTAKPLPGASYDWGNDVGFGRLNPAAAIDEAKRANDRTEVRPTRPPVKLHIFQSAHGDCLLLEGKDKKLVLCDGGMDWSMQVARPWRARQAPNGGTRARIHLHLPRRQRPHFGRAAAHRGRGRVAGPRLPDDDQPSARCAARGPEAAGDQGPAAQRVQRSDRHQPDDGRGGSAGGRGAVALSPRPIQRSWTWGWSSRISPSRFRRRSRSRG